MFRDTSETHCIKYSTLSNYICLNAGMGAPCCWAGNVRNIMENANLYILHYIEKNPLFIVFVSVTYNHRQGRLIRTLYIKH